MTGRQAPGIILQNGRLKSSMRSHILSSIIGRRRPFAIVTHIRMMNKETNISLMMVDKKPLWGRKNYYATGQVRTLLISGTMGLEQAISCLLGLQQVPI